jgi:hypothetical protein
MKVRSFARHVYAPQTMILEGGTKDEMWLLTVEKCCENLDFIFCSSFQNLRLGWIDFDMHIGILSQ